MDWSTLLLLISGVSFSGVGLSFWFYKYNQMYKRSFEKVSDAEILRLADQFGQLNSRLVATHTLLSKSEASVRIQYLSMYGGLRTLYDDWGSYHYSVRGPVRHLVGEELPPPSEEITEDQLIQFAEITGNHFTADQLCVFANIPFMQARKELRQWKKDGFLISHYAENYTHKIYSIPLESGVKLKLGNNKRLFGKEATPTRAIAHAAKKEVLSDAEIIQAAIEKNGKLTASSLCVMKDVSVDVAKKRLEELHEKQVFDLKVNDSGTIEYWLTDEDLLAEKG